MKQINGHTYTCVYAGIDVFVVDGAHYYDVASAANALGLSVDEFKEVW